MAARPLPSQAFLRECFDYDPLTGILRWRERPLHHFKNASYMERWNRRRAGRSTGYATASRPGAEPRLVINIQGFPWKSHRLIWRLMTGDDIPFIDHKNCDATDNRWENLRPATIAQNSHNQRGKKFRSIPKGIYHRYGKWYVRLSLGGKPNHIGVFETLDHAKHVYKICVHAIHGEFANTGER